MSKPTLRPIRAGEYETLLEAAHADEHYVLNPTHVVEKDGAIIGYAAINSIPTMHWWLSREKGTARDSLVLREQMDDLMLEKGCTWYVAPVGKGSPYVPFLEKMGFEKLMSTTLYTRDIVYERSKRDARRRTKGEGLQR